MTMLLKEFRIYPFFINLRIYKICSLCKKEFCIT